MLASPSRAVPGRASPCFPPGPELHAAEGAKEEEEEVAHSLGSVPTVQVSMGSGPEAAAAAAKAKASPGRTQREQGRL